MVVTRLKAQSLPTPTCPDLLRKIVSTLFPQQQEHEYRRDLEEEEGGMPVTRDELAKACAKVGTSKAPGMDGIPNIAIKTAISAAPEMFLTLYNKCLKKEVFPT